MEVSQLFVVESEQVQNRRVKIVDAYFIDGGFVAQLIRLAVVNAAVRAAAIKCKPASFTPKCESDSLKSRMKSKVYCDPVVEAYMPGVDRTLLRENLKLTPAQRLEKLASFSSFAAELRRAGQRAHLAKKR